MRMLGGEVKGRKRRRRRWDVVTAGEFARFLSVSTALGPTVHTYVHTYIRSQRNIRPGRFSHCLSSCSPHTFLLRPIVPQLHPPADRLLSVSTSSFPQPFPPPPPPHSSSSSVRPSSRCRLEFRTFGLSFPPVLFSDLPVVIPPSTRSGNGESEKARVVDWRIEVRRAQQFRLSISSHHAPASPVPSPASTT